MSRHHSGRRRRDFSKLNNRYVSKNYLKKWPLVIRDVKKNYGLQQTEVEFLLFAYDYEFFTISHIAKVMKRSRDKLYERTILPLKHREWIETVYDGRGVDEYVNQMFHEYSRHEHRLGLTQKARMMVQRIYRKLEGGEPINL